MTVTGTMYHMNLMKWLIICDILLTCLLDNVWIVCREIIIHFDQIGPFFFQLENKLLQFHLGNLEFSCAAPLSRVSSLSWDQNEAFPQFSGDHTLLQHGFGALLSNLALNLDVKLQYEVREEIAAP